MEKEHSDSMKQKAVRLIFTVLLLLCVLAILTATKRININQYLVGGYSVKGVDVSHYQGEIDWEHFREQGIDFAFIKATEGSSLVDERFEENREGAKAAGLYAGAFRLWWILSFMETSGKIRLKRHMWFPDSGNCLRPWKRNTV